MMRFPLLRAARRAPLAAALLFAVLAWQPPAVRAQAWSTEHWVATWGTGPAGPAPAARAPVLADQTLRLVVHTSIGGNRVRIRLSNELGSTPLRIGAAHVAVRASGSEVAPGTDRALTFGGRASVTIPAGAPALSDPVELAVAPLSDLAVSVYLPGTVRATTIHGGARQTSYVSLPGDFTAAATLPVEATIQSWPFLTEVDVDSAGAAVVALGDSITDGNASTPDTNRRWPAWLARRLQALRGADGRLGVVNRGISGNRLLSDAPAGTLAGRAAQERFDRDVLATAGVKYMTLMIGINDIGMAAQGSPVAAADIIGGYRQLLARAHAAGIAVYGATLAPFEGAPYYTPEKDAVREAVNDWIRNHGEFDAVIDFDAALRDPLHHARLLPAYDSGDHLHPNDRGYQAMAEAVPLTLFQPPRRSRDGGNRD